MKRSRGCRPRWARSPWRVVERQDRQAGGRPPFGPAEVEEMSRAHSISTHRRFGCPASAEPGACPGLQSTVIVLRQMAPRPPTRAPKRGPQGACSDAELLRHIQAVIAASPFSGEGYRKVWARLRAKGVRTAPRRARRVMKANGLLAPQRPVQRDAHRAPSSPRG